MDLIVFFVALLVLYNLYIEFMGNTEFPTISQDSFILFLKGIFGFVLYLSGTILFNTNKNRFSNIISIDFEPTRDIFLILGAILSYLLIQALGNILINIPAFQITSFQVYSFYLGGAEMEEMLWRGGVITFFQGLLVWVFFVPQRGKEFKLTNQDLFLINAIVVLGSGFLFMLDHDAYRGNLVAQIVTFLGGISQGVFFIAAKNLIGVSLAHFVINGIYAGGLIQTLGGRVT